MSAFISRPVTLRLAMLLVMSLAASASLQISQQASAQEVRPPRRADDRSKATCASGSTSSPASTKSDSQSSAWKSSAQRKWAASPRNTAPGSIQFVSANDSDLAIDSEEDVARPGEQSEPRVVSSPAKKKLATSPRAPATQPHSKAVALADDAPSPPETRRLTATERFKQALAAQRRALEQQSPLSTNETANTETANTSTEPGTMASSGTRKSTGRLGLSESPQSDLESDDPLKRERAERFLHLKSQLMQLKSRLQQAETPADFHPTPDNPHAPDAHAAGTGEAGVDTETPGTSTNASTSVDDMHEEHATQAESHGPDLHEPYPSGPESPGHAAVPETESPELPSESGGQQASPADANDRSTNPEHAEPHSGPLTDRPYSSTAPDKTVVEGPIDRIGLANNLYAVGEYRLAMDMYENATAGDLSAQQQIWAEYQTANCLRRLGKNSEASNRYRKLGGKPEAGWLSEQSNWWVEVLEQVRQLEKSLESDRPALVETAAHPGDHRVPAKTPAVTPQAVLYFSGQPEPVRSIELTEPGESPESAVLQESTQPTAESPPLLKELTDGEHSE